MDFSLSQLEYLVAVEDHGSFSLAAKHCFVTQPTLSMQIQKIEETLGLTLFDRSKKPVVVSSVGKPILEQARLVLRESNRMEMLAKNAKGVVAGDFTLGIIPTLSGSLLPKFLKTFSQQYPEVRLRIEEGQTQTLIERIKRDQLDGAIASTPLLDKSLTELALFYEPFFVYLSPKHPLLSKKQITQKEIREIQLWLMSEGHCFRNQVLEVCSRTQKDPRVSFQSGSFDTLVGLVDEGLGSTLLPQLFVEGLTSKQQKQVRPFVNPVPQREVGLVFHRAFVKKAILEAIQQTLLSKLPAHIAKTCRAKHKVCSPNSSGSN